MNREPTLWMPGVARQGNKIVETFRIRSGQGRVRQTHRGYYCMAHRVDENGRRVEFKGCFHQKRGAATKDCAVLARALNRELRPLFETDLYAEDPKAATALWGDGFRPVEARDVKPGDEIAWFETDVFSLGGTGTPKISTVRRTEHVRHAAWVAISHDQRTETDECSPVWTRRTA